MKQSAFSESNTSTIRIRVDGTDGIKTKTDLAQTARDTQDCLDIYNDLVYGKKSAADELADRFKTQANGKPRSYLHYLYIDVLFTCTRYIESLNGDITAVVPNAADYDSALNSIASADDLCSAIYPLLTAIYDYRDKNSKGWQGDALIQAQKYIDASFTQPTINLNTVAKECGISPNHLSFLFSRYAGITFIDYLTSLRLSKAQELLSNTGIRISEISFFVGYNDSHYFSSIFKKHIGMTPSEYRKLQREDKTQEK